MKDDDLRAEVQFHIDMRAAHHRRTGMPRDQADALASEQFGDMEAAMKGMRQARSRTPKAVFVALTLTSLVAAGLWLSRVSAPAGPVVFPQLPRAPLELKTQKRPPPPPPGPTWEEFVAKVNTFGDGSRAKSRPR